MPEATQTPKAKKAKTTTPFKVDVVNGTEIASAGSIAAANSLEAHRKLEKLNSVARRILGDSIVFQSPDINYGALRDAGLIK